MSLSLEEFSSVLKENDKINSENVKIIIKELTEKLKKSTEEMNEVKRRDLPKIKEIQKEKKEIYEEIERLKRELNELNSIKPISVLEKRKNDFKTEGEYISKILNRNIKEEFVNQMKRELKQLAADESESFDQVLCTAIPGCDELNEKFDEKGVEGVLISQKTEKFLTVLNACHGEIGRKVYKDEEKERRTFEAFCYELICSYFRRRTTRSNTQNINANTTINSHCKSVSTHVNSHASLPQFAAVLLNDLNVSIVFCSVHFTNCNLGKLKKLAKTYFEAFLREQKEEISSLISGSVPNDKSVKRVALFLSRLEKVLKPLMLKNYFKNLQFILLNFAQETIWKNLIGISDISVDEIEGLVGVCKQTVELDKGTYEFAHLLLYKPKLACFQKILNLSLIEIINSYHRREFKEICESDLAGIVKSVFASTALRNEFIKELELGDYEEEDDEEYEYF